MRFINLYRSRMYTIHQTRRGIQMEQYCHRILMLCIQFKFRTKPVEYTKAITVRQIDNESIMTLRTSVKIQSYQKG